MSREGRYPSCCGHALCLTSFFTRISVSIRQKLSSFKRDFKAIYNMTPASWIREKRLEKAKEMLEATQLPVSEICYSLGFENISHFSRIFKEYHGQAPTVFRH
ncbi:helix-turn-helix domain-containing protein [Sphingobacterium sp. IITKGP-BTPF85]|uniref:helix-turn-helix domain-containing protein n=1 Tax=Sphingobacterium sp. IITKGP-BTPF85 TaxID=1338009 RepID=UPI0021D2D27D|nr:helix-turn-helix transcriptional regulator [Sphingobacterium sp. IITKGP-BTPF85]